MATPRFFLRVGSWYKSASGKALSSDLEITDVVNDTDPNDPFVEDDGSGGGASVQSITAGTNITLGGTASNPVINASGGGGSQNLDEVLAAGSTLTEDRPIGLGGHTLSFNNGLDMWLGINPGSGTVDLVALLAEAPSGSYAGINLRQQDDKSFTSIGASFGDDDSTYIEFTAELGVTGIEYTANTHTFEGVLNLEVQAAPVSPNDGDIWREDNTNTGLKIRINGVTKTITVS